ncbi:Mnn4p NDAI_0D01460 [Naumovozyma dairenensis CBS 421]|uniref:LicD/FKTN/FKRP nucleotidyltransferase domain-containing protein n=1 Tax=Naumovozyma dairenensis (strain ATCC 10597 / BCRC 20456 / CBS 421 / NBRC 0211 / NRRL Y-12639) TaxID=1071378 RepID=G0W9J9_NAUDC|nr:hypothetical protein NDAI_0D01460 [Naumovozyma dairenensis CBS 421]CCD24460.1 hypothetical protein NDAI_0D01460 [Naumovozyma dairenensis CBS 421]
MTEKKKQFYRKSSRFIIPILSKLNATHLRQALASLIVIQFIITAIIWSTYNSTSVSLTTNSLSSSSSSSPIPLLFSGGGSFFDAISSFSPFSSSSSQAVDDAPKFISTAEPIEVEDDIGYAAALYRKIKFDTKPTWIDDYTLKKNLLTVNVGPRRGQRLKHTDELRFYDFDPRLSWSVYLHYLLSQNYTSILNEASNSQFDFTQPFDAQSTNASASPRTTYTNLNHKVTMPFSWYDWTDFHELNKIIALEKAEIRCEFMFNSAFDIETLSAIETEIDETLFLNDRDKYDNKKWYRLARKSSVRHESTKIDKVCEKINPEDTYVNLRNSSIPKKLPRFTTQFKIKRLFDKLRPEVFQLQARNYILTTQKHPLSLTIVANNNASYQINLEQNERLNLVESNLLRNFVEDYQNSPEFLKEVPMDSLSTIDSELPSGKITPEGANVEYDLVFNHYKVFQDFLDNEDIAKIFKVDIPETDKSFFDYDLVHLQHEDFEFDVEAKIKELESIPESELSPHFKQYLESLKVSSWTIPTLQKKYFEEAGQLQQFKGMGHHRDQRFFNGDNLINDEQEYFGRLNSMIRTFQKFTRSNGLISWLSHGTLYGYLYNGHSFPWDNDFDLQLPIKHLHLLAQYFNQSLILEDPREGNGRYLIDIGTSITVRTNGNGKNNIDARLVDVDTGLYIDLTGLSVSNGEVRENFADWMKKKAKELHINLDKEKVYDESEVKDLDKFDGKDLRKLNCTQLVTWIEKHQEKFSKNDLDKAREAVKKETVDIPKSRSGSKNLNPRERYEVNKKLQLFNCRNNHYTNLELVSPLINTVFHGVPALIPSKYIASLKKEYGVPKEYYYLTFEKMTFLPELRGWFKTHYIDRCSNLHGWFPPKFTKLPNTDSLKNISFPAVKTLYQNIQKAGYIDMFANHFNCFHATSYRLKELEIQYGADLTPEQKRIYLHDLRTNVAPKLNSPAKDPIIFQYERHIYNRLLRKINDTTVVAALENSIQMEHVSKVWELTMALKHKKFDIFNITRVVRIPSPDGLSYHEKIDNVDLNQVGNQLFANYNGSKIQIFDKDPVLDFQTL